MDMNYFPFLIFTVIMTATPGPNNMLLTLLGARHGYRKTLPFLLGVVAGILSLICLSALGLGWLFEEFPLLQKGLKLAGASYILYLAGKILLSVIKKEDKGKENTPGRPSSPESLSGGKPRFSEGFLFQYLNPKVYITTLSAVSVYSLPGGDYPLSVMIIFLTFALIAPLSISLWAALGTALGKFGTGKWGKPVNLLLGLLTASSAAFILL